MEKKFNKILVVAVAVVVIFMSMGYSILNKQLNISGELAYRVKGDIRITNMKQKSLSDATIQYADFSKNEINFAFDATSVSASVSYEVEVTNYTDTPMGILKIDGLGDATIEGYNLKEKLKNTNGALKAGDSTTFIITFKASQTGIQQFLLEFDFEPVCKVTYNGFDNTDNYKKEVLNGDNFNQNIGKDTEVCSITMNGSAISDYTFLNGILDITKVTGDIVIDGYVPVIEEPTTPNAPELNGDMIPVRYDQLTTTTGNWVKADVANNGNDWYDYTNQKWANAVTVKNTVNDVSGNSNDGLIRGNAVIGNGEAILDGVDDYIDAGFANYDFKNNITFVLRFKFNITPTNYYELFGNWDGAGGGLAYNSSSKSFNVNLFDEVTNAYQYTNIIKTVDLNEFCTMVGTYDGKTMSIYVNGEKASKDISMKIKKSIIPVIIGGNLNGSSLDNSVNITISDALIFDKALAEDEINAHYINEITLGNTRPLFYYNFNDVNREYYKKASAGTKIEMDDINTMWVWIPRYSYTIKSEDGNNYYGKKTSCTMPTQSLPGEIDVKFISKETELETGTAKYIDSTATNWRTNEAFDFGGEAKAGIWVGKFETTGSLEKNGQACTDTNCNVSEVTVLPNTASIRNQSVSSFFYMARSMQKSNSEIYGFSSSDGDLHMMKNDEWGAVAYLSQSRYGKYGNKDYSGANKEVYQNKSSSYITGSSNGTPGQSTTNNPQYSYNDMKDLGQGKGQAGPGASTTGTIYGVYDMSGGANECVMGV